MAGTTGWVARAWYRDWRLARDLRRLFPTETPLTPRLKPKLRQHVRGDWIP